MEKEEVKSQLVFILREIIKAINEATETGQTQVLHFVDSEITIKPKIEEL